MNNCLAQSFFHFLTYSFIQNIFKEPTTCQILLSVLRLERNRHSSCLKEKYT